MTGIKPEHYEDYWVLPPVRNRQIDEMSALRIATMPLDSRNQ